MTDRTGTVQIAYPADIVPEEDPSDGYVATFPDVGSCVAGEETWAEILSSAADALRAALGGYTAGEPLPRPSVPEAGQVMILLDPVTAAKVALHWALEERGEQAADLARAMGVSQRHAENLLDIDRPTGLDELAPAVAILGLSDTQAEGAIPDRPSPEKDG